ncbi:MAG: alpha/beta fold hydrolase, partial [Thermoleophilaceae bacterium]
VHTARSIIDIEGQRVSARDRLYLAAEVPTLLIWGERDPIIPAKHGREAQREIPHSRLELFPDAGHFPYKSDPQRFVDALSAFIEETEPADVDSEQLRDQLLTRAGR